MLKKCEKKFQLNPGFYHLLLRDILRYFLKSLGLENHNFLQKIIWVRPPWGDQLPDGIKSLHCGFSNDLITGKPTRLSVSWPTEYYTSDGTFSKTEDIISHSSPFDFMTILAQNFETQPQFIAESWFLDVDLGKDLRTIILCQNYFLNNLLATFIVSVNAVITKVEF